MAYPTNYLQAPSMDRECLKCGSTCTENNPSQGGFLCDICFTTSAPATIHIPSSSLQVCYHVKRFPTFSLVSIVSIRRL